MEIRACAVCLCNENNQIIYLSVKRYVLSKQNSGSKLIYLIYIDINFNLRMKYAHTDELT